MWWKWHSDESVINDEKGRWWVKEKTNKQTKKQKQIKNKEEWKKERILSEQWHVSDPPMVVDTQSYAVSDVP